MGGLSKKGQIDVLSGNVNLDASLKWISNPRSIVT